MNFQNPFVTVHVLQSILCIAVKKRNASQVYTISVYKKKCGNIKMAL